MCYHRDDLTGASYDGAQEGRGVGAGVGAARPRLGAREAVARDKGPEGSAALPRGFPGKTRALFMAGIMRGED